MNDLPPVLATAFLPVNARLSVETIKVREARVVARTQCRGHISCCPALRRTLAAGGNNLSAWRNGKTQRRWKPRYVFHRKSGQQEMRNEKAQLKIIHAGANPAALSILPSAQCSTGTSQSRRHPARPGKVTESAGHQRHGTVALPGEIWRIKVQTAAPAAGSV